MNVGDSATLCLFFLFLVAVIFGIPVGLIISKVRKKLSTKDMICPECGKTTVRGEKVTMDQENGFEINFANLILAFGAMLFGILWLVVMLSVGIFKFPQLMVLGDAVLIVIGVFFSVTYFRKNKVTVHRYACRSCSHQWSEEIVSAAKM